MVAKPGSPFEFLNQYYFKANKVKDSQKYFQSGQLPVYLKGQTGIFSYRAFMFGTSVGLIFAAYQFSQMALGKLKRS